MLVVPNTREAGSDGETPFVFPLSGLWTLLSEAQNKPR